MKFANDIKALIEDDVKRLTEGLLTGDVALADGRGLTDVGLSEGDVHRLAGEVLRFAVQERLLSVLMAALGSMKWLSFEEAVVYSRMGGTKLKEKIADHNCPIYGAKMGDGEKSSWVVDRESIDAFYNRSREDFILEVIEQVQEGRHG